MTYNLNFHQTFPPTAEFIMRLLEVCDSGTALTKEQISEITGIPTGKSSGKVEPHISYSEYMGLIKDERVGGKHSLFLTPLGREVLKQDPGLQEKVSIAVCHARITSRFGGALLWMAMFKEVMPKYPQGISDLLLKNELEKRFDSTVKTGPFFSAYTGMFKDLYLIGKKGSLSVIQKGIINKDFLYVYAYALLYEWESAYPGQVEITASELDALFIAETFGLEHKVFYEVLESMAEKGIIRFNRQLAPYTLLRLREAEEIIPYLFSELC